jgi:hypothetical protein
MLGGELAKGDANQESTAEIDSTPLCVAAVQGQPARRSFTFLGLAAL